MEAVRELLARGAAVDTADNDGNTPLCIASWKGHLEVVRELLTRGAAVDTARNDGATPLYLASLKGHLEVVRELLARGASRHVLSFARSPLQVATSRGHHAIAELLRAPSAL